MRTKSLTARTVLVALAAQLLCAVVLCTTALLHEVHTRRRALDAQLQGSSDSLLGAVQDAEDADANITLDPTELKLPALDVFAVYAKDGRLVGSSTNAPAQLIARAKDGYREVRTRDDTYRVLQRHALRIIDRAEHGGVGLRRPVTIVYAISESHLHHEVVEAARFYVITVLLATGAMALVLPTLIRHTLRPLVDLTSATNRIQPPTFGFTAPSSAMQLDELRPLTEMIHVSLDRVHASFLREQQFVSDAAHELKTAVAVVQSSAQLLLLRPRSEAEYRKGIERIVDDAHRLELLIAQMLLLARTEENPKFDGAHRTQLKKSLDQVTTLLQPVAEQRQVRVTVQCGVDALVRSRPELVEILLTNLLLNAIQHSAPGSLPIAVTAEKEASGTVHMIIKDHGCGIHPAALPHIFERFYREDSSRSRTTGGTGLGLAIAKSIVDASGGSIRVASEPGIGTTMHVVFMSA